MGKGIYPPSVQPGIPRLGKTPDGWKKVTFGDILTDIQRPVKLVDNKEYQLVVAKRSRGGIEPRERLIGKKILTKTQFEIKARDFLISNRQIVHGACGIVPANLDGAVVSNEYSVLHSKPDLDLIFLNHFTNSTFFQQTCFHASVGVDVEKMIFRIDEWFKRELNLPPLAEQKKIAEILSTWDRAIESVNTARTRFKAYQKLRLNLFFQDMSGIAEMVKLGDACDVKSGGTPNRSNPAYFENGRIPWLKSGEVAQGEIFNAEEFITELGLKESSANIIPAETSVVAMYGATAGKVGILRSEMAINQAIAAVLPKDKNLRSDYIYLCLRYLAPSLLRKVQGSGQPNLNSGMIKDLKIPLCDLEQQDLAAKFIMSIFKQVDNYELLASRISKQKQGLMQKLLTGKVRVKV
jgi:type I restriction enzyme S subunit